MKNVFTSGLFASLILFAYGQQSLSLEEAVTGQFRQFAPQRINQLGWLPGSDMFAYVKNDTLFHETVKGKKIKALTFSELNNILGPDNSLKTFPALTWKDASTCFFFDGTRYLDLDLKSSKVTLRSIQDKEAANPDYHAGSGQLAYTKENNLFIRHSGNDVQITRNEAGIVSGQSISRNEYGITKGTFWSPKGNALAFYEKDERQVADYPLIDYSEIPAKVNLIKYPMAGAKSEIVAVGIHHIASGKTIYLDLFGASRKSDGYYATNLSWSPDEKSVFIVWMNRATTELQLRRFDASTGKETGFVLSEKDSKWLEPLQPIVFVPGSEDRFLWYSWKDGYHNYYLYNLSGALLGQTKAPFELLEISGFNDRGTEMIVSGTGPDPRERHYYRVNLQDMSMTQLTAAPGTHDALVSSRGGYVLDSYSSLEIPNRTVLSKEGREIRELLRAVNPLEKYAYGKTEFVTLSTETGVPLYGRIIKPTRFESREKYPVLVYVYNGPHVQLVTNTWLGGSSLWQNYLAEQGYIVFTIDGRGSHNRGKSFEQSVYRQLGELEMKDQETGINWLRSQPWVDQERMAIHGWSFGGFMTASMMLRKPGMFKVGVAGGAVIDWKMYEVMYTERYMDTPEENPDGYRNADLTGLVKNLEGDLLMIHGTDDDVVVMQHTMRFLESCIDEKIPVDFFAYPGHAHNVRGQDRIHLIRKIIEYINEKLGTAPHQ